MIGRFLRTSAILMAALGLVMVSQSTAYCQNGVNGGGNGGGNQGGGGQGNQGNGTGTGGIEIDADGVLSTRALRANSGALNQQLHRAAKANLNKDIQRISKLRKISLTRLEKEVAKLVEAGKPIPADMQYLAGMTRLTHVFYFPESKDIVIAGPAEGYFVTAGNRVVGTQTGQATLQLQDLIVALRAFAPGGEKTSLISVSIDPTQEGLVRFKQTVPQVAAQFRPGDEARAVKAYCDALGLQEITINGVSTNTHFARILVEADYHMKLIGIGLEKPAVDIISFISKTKSNTLAKNSLMRWFFQPNYDCVQINEDETAMELVGSGVKLVGEDESVARNGSRRGSGGMNGASRAFCGSFTRMYDKLATKDPLWAELRNLVDMSIAAAFIQKMDLYGQAEWNMDVFGDESKVAVEVFDAPKHVKPLANGVWKGRHFITPIAGGVNIQPRVALNSDRIQQDTEGKIDAVKNDINLDNLADGQWWWD
jgi:hypothetical protein